MTAAASGAELPEETPAPAFAQEATGEEPTAVETPPATPFPPRSTPSGPGPQPVRPSGPGGPGEELVQAGATAPQLRRFIKSRPYVPLHELRRRFGIVADEDTVHPVDLETGRLWVGLPAREAALLAELLRAGDIGCERSYDPVAPVIVGVYPIRPVSRS